MTGLLNSTIFKYAVAYAATYLATKLGLDPVEGKATIMGVITQLFGVGAAVWGIWESSRPKIVSPDKTVVHLDKPGVTPIEKAKVNTLADAIKALTKR